MLQPSEARGETSELSTPSGESQCPQRGQPAADFPFPILQPSSGQQEVEKAREFKARFSDPAHRVTMDGPRTVGSQGQEGPGGGCL